MKTKIGRYAELGGYGAIIASAVAAARHPVIIILLILAAGALLTGRVLQNQP